MCFFNIVSTIEGDSSPGDKHMWWKEQWLLTYKMAKKALEILEKNVASAERPALFFPFCYTGNRSGRQSPLWLFIFTASHEHNLALKIKTPKQVSVQRVLWDSTCLALCFKLSLYFSFERLSPVSSPCRPLELSLSHCCQKSWMVRFLLTPLLFFNPHLKY